jgi:hypothetical protein
MALDSPILRDGDAAFIGFASRLNPLLLEPGMLQMSVNMRLDRGVAQTRKGAKRLASDVSTGSEPLTLSFDMAADIAATFSRSGATVTATTATAHGLTTADQVAIEGAGDAAYNGDFIVTVTGPTTFTYTADSTPAAATDAGTVNAGPIVQSTYSGGIFTAGIYSSPVYDNGREYAVLCGPGAAYLYREGESLVTKAYPSSPDEAIEATDTVSVVQAFDRLYVLREADQTVTGWGTKLTNSSGVTVSGTTATVNVTGHGYTAGMRVRLTGSTTAAFDGHEFDIATAAADAFTITVLSGTATHAAAGISVRRVKAPIYWDGGSGAFVRSPGGVPDEGPTYKRMRSCGWASYINNRFVIPDGRDSVALSDLLDPNLYDPYWSTFRANQGSNDSLVAVHPWVEGSFLVFMRRSIWLAEITDLNVAAGSDALLSRLTLLTDEIGCSARKSIATAGQFVYFLSDSGVYRLDARLDLKLRGDTRPLSEPIDDQFSDLAADYVPDAVGVWYGNRYYLAVPKGEETSNTSVYLWNALNDRWETKDTYGFGVQDFLVITYGGQRRLCISNQAGALMLLDENEEGDSETDAAKTDLTAVGGEITTRRWQLGSPSDKRFLRVLSDVVIPAGATVQAEATSINPDGTVVLQELSNATGDAEDYAYKLPVRVKAHGMDVTFRTTAGRPQIRSVVVEAAGKSLDPTDTKTAA